MRERAERKRKWENVKKEKSERQIMRTKDKEKRAKENDEGKRVTRTEE